MIERDASADDGTSPPDAARDLGQDLDMAAMDADRDASTMDASADTGPTDLGFDEGPDDTGVDAPTECGRYGEVCCTGGACAEGACAANRCAAFGGTYAVVRLADSDPRGSCRSANLYTGDCSCPAGFLPQELGDLDNAADEGVGFGETLFACRLPVDRADADFRGGFGRITGGFRATSECMLTPVCTENAYTSDCTCADGATELRFPGARFNSGPNDCAVEATFCRGPGAPLTFAGAYRVNTETARFCDGAPECEPNPVTGACSCPVGFVGWNVGAFLQFEAPGGRTACDATLTVCMRAPE